jgi:hypothetical protein
VIELTAAAAIVVATFLKKSFIQTKKTNLSLKNDFVINNNDI